METHELTAKVHYHLAASRIAHPVGTPEWHATNIGIAYDDYSVARKYLYEKDGPASEVERTVVNLITALTRFATEVPLKRSPHQRPLSHQAQ